MSDLSSSLRNELLSMGASIVGFADLSGLPEEARDGMQYAVSIAIAVDPEVINGLANGPTREYYEEYVGLNKALDKMDVRAAEIIRGFGFNAVPKLRNSVKIDYDTNSTVLPHKTVATRAGLGWIGKCAQLVTEKYGSAVRIASVLTDAPLNPGVPINESRCGSCDDCVRYCPANAATGDIWSVHKYRDEFFNAQKCRETARERTMNIAPGETHCGICIVVCPWTKRYIECAGLVHQLPQINTSVNTFPRISRAGVEDLEEVLAVQKAAFGVEARIYNDYCMAPLVQTIEELRQEAESKVILKAVMDNRIIGSVRAFEEDGTCYIGRLVVHPDYHNRGVGKRLMLEIERRFRGCRYELFTGHRSEKNIAFYERMGYKQFKTEKVREGLQFIFMEKNKRADA